MRPQYGISLIELLITVLVLSGSMLALTRLQTQTLNTAAHNKQRTEALAYAEQSIEALRSKMERANCELTAANLQKLAFISPPTKAESYAGSHNTLYRSYTLTPVCKNNADGSNTAPGAGQCAAGIATAKAEVQVRWDDVDKNVDNSTTTPPDDKYLKLQAVFPDFRQLKTATAWSNKDWGKGDIVNQGTDNIMCINAAGCLGSHNKPKANDADSATSEAAYWAIISTPYCPKV
ncbi:MAG: type IV pilus modification PilV family protein [Iodobacter sp.]